MRTSNLFLIAVVFIFGWTSTLEAQRLSRPLRTNISAAAYQGIGLGNRRSGSDQWYPYVVARPVDRSWIREMPMQHRPNRPLHFWGNSRRRRVAN